MLAGNPMLRNTTGESRGICHRCFEGPDFTPFGGAPCTGNDTTSLPDHFCPGGIRTQVTFPTCWDGVNLDSPGHQRYMPRNSVNGDVCAYSMKLTLLLQPRFICDHSFRALRRAIPHPTYHPRTTTREMSGYTSSSSTSGYVRGDVRFAPVQ